MYIIMEFWGGGGGRSQCAPPHPRPPPPPLYATLQCSPPFTFSSFTVSHL